MLTLNGIDFTEHVREANVKAEDDGVFLKLFLHPNLDTARAVVPLIGETVRLLVDVNEDTIFLGQVYTDQWNPGETYTWRVVNPLLVHGLQEESKEFPHSFGYVGRVPFESYAETGFDKSEWGNWG